MTMKHIGLIAAALVAAALARPVGATTITCTPDGPGGQDCDNNETGVHYNCSSDHAGGYDCDGDD